MDLVSLFNLDETEDDKAGTPNRQIELWADTIYSSVTLSLTIILFVRKNKLQFPKKLLECIDSFKFTLELLEKIAPDTSTDGEPEEKPEIDLTEIPGPPLDMKKIKHMAKAMCKNTPMCKCIKGKKNSFHTEKFAEDTLPLMDWTNPPPKKGAMTFLNVNIPEGDSFTYSLHPFQQPCSFYKFTKINDGYFRIYSIADGITEPPLGTYRLTSEAVDLGCLQITEFNHVYMLIDVETEDQVDIDEGIYRCDLAEKGKTVKCKEVDNPLVKLRCSCNGGPDYLYFVTRTSIAGMFRVMYCDVDAGRQPFSDGIYPLWDVCPDGNTTPSTLEEGVYYMVRNNEQLDKILKKSTTKINRGKLVCERFIKIESEADPQGLNITRIITHTKHYPLKIKKEKSAPKPIPILEFKQAARSICCKCPQIEGIVESDESVYDEVIDEDEELGELIDMEAEEEYEVEGRQVYETEEEEEGIEVYNTEEQEGIEVYNTEEHEGIEMYNTEEQEGIEMYNTEEQEGIEVYITEEQEDEEEVIGEYETEEQVEEEEEIEMNETEKQEEETIAQQQEEKEELGKEQQEATIPKPPAIVCVRQPTPVCPLLDTDETIRFSTSTRDRVISKYIDIEIILDSDSIDDDDDDDDDDGECDDPDCGAKKKKKNTKTICRPCAD